MTVYKADTVLDLLAQGGDTDNAIGAPGAPWLTFQGLRALAHRTVAFLNANGIGRGDRVAIVLPNGPEAASCFVAVACGATAAPLNPGYKLDEFAFNLADLTVRAVIVMEGVDSPAIAAARSLGIPLIWLVPGSQVASSGGESGAGRAGDFTLRADNPGAETPPAKPGPALARPASSGAALPGPASKDDIALVLHTSGTTSRPKIVPLSHLNVTASAYNIAQTLALGPSDVGLNIMPLFHIHGLIAATLASLAAGASVSCTPGFNAFRFFSWFASERPTWYTAVPPMHQAILGLAGRNAKTIAEGRLRFIRSSSASLPPQVMTAMEAAFGVPVLESYGMTEAAHQMASNPLPPAARYPGSVGVAAGPEIAILAPDGAILPAGETGEVAIRGRNVTTGYDNNPSANAAAFTNGWFRTGDEGTLDADGYLRLTGRLKEIINRGGEKVSPLEVDAVLMDHPAVAQCLTFALPHPMLGEEVAAAIVLREGLTCQDTELREFAATRLAAFKVPRRVVFLDEIPKGATGKLMRVGLAQKLGLVE
jgi:acyl-CoA synthetase (AMP-forming)/AMP-acid ligase II